MGGKGGGGVLIRARGSDFFSKKIKRGGTSIRDLRVTNYIATIAKTE